MGVWRGSRDRCHNTLVRANGGPCVQDVLNLVGARARDAQLAARLERLGA